MVVSREEQPDIYISEAIFAEVFVCLLGHKLL